MERAGAAAAEVALGLATARGGVVVVLAGPGNNGGDGFVVARILKEAFHDVAVVFRDDAERLPADAAAALARFRSAGGVTLNDPPAAPVALIVDALFGIGQSRALTRTHADLVDWANRQTAPKLAIDIPTGLDANSGIARAPAIHADATATFIALKPGLLTAEGPDFCGSVSVHALGLDVEGAAVATLRALDWPSLAATLPEVLQRRVRNANKGTFGTLAIVGGAEGMTGATLIAGRAALRAGAGKVKVGLIASPATFVDAATPELMLNAVDPTLASPVNALVVGCGLGRSDEALAVLRRALDQPVPLVLDADALNLMAEDAGLRAAVRRRDAVTVATPHPAEAARLLASSVAAVQRDRLDSAAAIARELRAHVVLKGVGSVLAHPDGALDINTTGNATLSVAGSGDALAGIVGAFLAQAIDARTALRYAVCLHGAAADALLARGVGPIGVSTGEVVDAARDLLNAAARRLRGTPAAAPEGPR